LRDHIKDSEKRTPVRHGTDRVHPSESPLAMRKASGSAHLIAQIATPRLQPLWVPNVCRVEARAEAWDDAVDDCQVPAFTTTTTTAATTTGYIGIRASRSTN
jgi:hypothetical protein